MESELPPELFKHIYEQATPQVQGVIPRLSREIQAYTQAQVQRQRERYELAVAYCILFVAGQRERPLHLYPSGELRFALSFHITEGYYHSLAELITAAQQVRPEIGGEEEVEPTYTGDIYLEVVDPMRLLQQTLGLPVRPQIYDQYLEGTYPVGPERERKDGGVIVGQKLAELRDLGGQAEREVIRLWRSYRLELPLYIRRLIPTALALIPE